MRTQRATVTVGHRVGTLGPKDTRGNRPLVHADEVDLVVSSYWIGSSTEPAEPGRQAVQVDAAVHAFPGTVVGPHDLLLLDGVEFKVEGHPVTGSINPFTRRPAGVVVNLKRVDG